MRNRYRLCDYWISGSTPSLVERAHQKDVNLPGQRTPSPQSTILCREHTLLHPAASTVSYSSNSHPLPKCGFHRANLPWDHHGQRDGSRRHTKAK